MKKNMKFGIALINAVFVMHITTVVGIGTRHTGEDDLWKIRATDPTNYVGIALSNGRIGMVPSTEPFKVKSIILNNVYDRAAANDVSKILEGINSIWWLMVIPSGSQILKTGSRF